MSVNNEELLHHPLIIAIEKGQASEVERLLKEGAGVNGQESWPYVPFKSALEHGAATCRRVITILIEHGLDLPKMLARYPKDVLRLKADFPELSQRWHQRWSLDELDQQLKTQLWDEMGRPRRSLDLTQQAWAQWCLLLLNEDATRLEGAANWAKERKLHYSEEFWGLVQGQLVEDTLWPVADQHIPMSSMCAWDMSPAAWSGAGPSAWLLAKMSKSIGPWAIIGEEVQHLYFQSLALQLEHVSAGKLRSFFVEVAKEPVLDGFLRRCTQIESVIIALVNHAPKLALEMRRRYNPEMFKSPTSAVITFTGASGSLRLLAQFLKDNAEGIRDACTVPIAPTEGKDHLNLAHLWPLVSYNWPVKTLPKALSLLDQARVPEGAVMSGLTAQEYLTKRGKMDAYEAIRRRRQLAALEKEVTVSAPRPKGRM